MGYYFYAKEINRDIPIAELMTMYGLKTKGNVSCPIMEHEDKKPSARVYEGRNICKCFSCNASIKPIDLVMKRENCSFYDACEALIKNFSLPIENYAEVLFTEREDSVKPTLPLSYQELSKIGLNLNIKIISRYDVEKEESFCEMRETGSPSNVLSGMMKPVIEQRISLLDEYMEDKDFVLEMMIAKTNEKKAGLQYQLLELKKMERYENRVLQHSYPIERINKAVEDYLENEKVNEEDRPLIEKWCFWKLMKSDLLECEKELESMDVILSKLSEAQKGFASYDQEELDDDKENQYEII